MTEEQPTNPVNGSDWQSTNIWQGSGPSSIQPGDRIGGYVIRDQIGQGGFGMVYFAEQTHPVQREVALKVIKPGMDSEAVVARFEAERQALAVMNHPNVAKVFDGGATADGRPYFVMEYVPGVPITTFCDEHRLSIEARIELFVQVCDAVQHAHIKGLIHRDLKPANVLVEQRVDGPMPKVIDFGVAKALQRAGVTNVGHTQVGELIGTPEYMSPEQADPKGLDIDTRTDVYSLGVILYELFTGAVPFDAKTLLSSGYQGLQRIISEVDPPKPSTRLSTWAMAKRSDTTRSERRMPDRVEGDDEAAQHTVSQEEIAAGRQTDCRTLVRRLRGDLDWIVMKCLEKDRDRRYDTAADLAMELRRHLKNEPVLAGPPSTVYRLRKFVRRNRAGVLAGAMIAAVLVLCATVSVIFAISALESERYAERQAGEAQRQGEIAAAINTFLTDDLLRSVAPERFGRDVPMREVLDAAAEQLEQQAGAAHRFADKPEVEAGIRRAIGRTYHTLGDYEEARHHLEREVALLEAALGPDAVETIEALHELGLVYRSQGEFDRAEKLLRQSMERASEQLGEDDPNTLSAINSIAGLYRAQGRIAEAEPYYVKALDGRRRVLGRDHPDTLVSLNNMGALLRTMGRAEEAEPYYREALEGFRRVYTDGHPNTLTAMNNMGVLLRTLGRVDEAIPFYREALEGRRKVLGPDHHRTLTSINNMGHLLQSQGQLAEAEQYFREALDGLKRSVGERHQDTLNAMLTLAQVLRAQEKLNEAEPYYRQSLAGLRQALGNDHPDTLAAIATMGQYYRARGDADAAEPYYREALEGLRDAVGIEHPRTQTALSNLSFLLRSQQRYEDAEPYSRELFEVRQHALGRYHRQALAARITHADVLREIGRLEESETLLREGIEIAEQSIGELDQIIGDLLASLSRTLIALERTGEARETLVQAIDVLSQTLGDDHDATIEAQQLLVRLDESE